MATFDKCGDYEVIADIVPQGQQLIDDLDCIVKNLTNKSIQKPLYMRLRFDSYLISNRVRALNFKGKIHSEYDFNAEEDGAKIKITFKIHTPSGWILSYYYLLF